ncbi:BREX system P-loop protein BrxC [Atopobiaceae bacterium LCP21S3_F11]
MRIQDMFERDIDRDINGVVKVAQEDESAVEQELSEYVVTRELAGHFANFFSAYESALDKPTDKIGVWVSGFFGSGKSHFLKMLSYLLTNQVVNGRHATDYFNGKFEDPMVDASARRCASVTTESILFNIDNKAVGKKDADILKRTFARVFYDHLGFYGEDLKLARLERFVDDKGLTQNFRDAFEQINGEPWTDARAEYDFFSDDLIDALEQAGVMSADEARRWLDDPNGGDLSIETLTDQIRDYAAARAKEYGGNFRLLFMIDEIGQFIGSDSNLMLNLQTIVEELSTKCAGRVWVMVTSQEAIDEVTEVVGQDFSKIQGRFNTRLSLSSSSADEVIKRRILEKNEPAADLLRAQYAETSSVLKNLFTFEKSTADLIGYANGEEFVQTFPFASYQFRLMQNVMSEIRKHGNSGKHLSSGERSMLSGFQETAQRIEGRDENALVPFWMFYDAVQTFLESYIRRVVDRADSAAAEGQGLEPQDVNVLKLLFLLRWEDGLATTLGNIVTLMTDDVRADRMALRESVQDSLDRLVHENYVSRNGDTYQFPPTTSRRSRARSAARTRSRPA